MDLVWKYPKHLHFQGFPIGRREQAARTLQNNPTQKAKVSVWGPAAIFPIWFSQILESTD